MEKQTQTQWYILKAVTVFKKQSMISKNLNAAN
jgi:hypothetical protein